MAGPLLVSISDFMINSTKASRQITVVLNTKLNLRAKHKKKKRREEIKMRIEGQR